MKKEPEVFISYSSIEYKSAAALREVLEENDISCWMAPQSIPAGSDYTRAIPQGIKGAKVFLLVLSDNAQQSKWVTAEVESAFENRKIIIPYAIENCDLNDEFGFMIAKTDRIDGYRRRNSSLEQLIRTINNALGRSESEKQKLLRIQRRKRLRIILSVTAVLLVIAAVIGGFLLGNKSRRDKKISGTDTNDSGESVGQISWKYDKKAKELTISGSGRMQDYDYSNPAPWDTVCEQEDHGVIDIVVEDGITQIGNYAFSGLFAASISLPDTVTRLGDSSLAFNYLEDLTLPESLEVIEEQALQGTRITEIDIPDSVTAIGDNCFEGCGDLQTVELPVSLTKLGNDLFEDCDDLESVILPEENDSFVMEDDVIFSADKKELRYYLAKEESYTVPDSVESIGGYAFSNTDIKAVTLPQGLDAIESYAFAYCRELTDVNLPDTVTELGENAFSSCEKLAEIDIPPHVTEIPSAAFMGTAIREAVVPDGVTKLGGNAFSDCDHLTEITIPASVTEIDDIFYMDNNPDTVIRCEKGSEAEMYAINGNSEGITYRTEYID